MAMESVLCISRLCRDNWVCPISARTRRVCCSRDPKCKGSDLMRCCFWGVWAVVSVWLYGGSTWEQECGRSAGLRHVGLGRLRDRVGEARRDWQDLCRGQEELTFVR